MRQLDAATSICRRLARREGVTGAFLAGSASAGLATPTSDVDVYLVGPTLAPDRTQLDHDGVRLDVHCVAHGMVAEVATAATATLPAVADHRPGPSEAELSLTTRLATMTVVEEDRVLNELRASLAERRPLLRRQLVRHFLARAESQHEDVRGFLDTGDLDSALLSATSALTSAAKAVTVACDDVYFGDKWVLAQLRRSAPHSFPHRLVVALLTGAETVPDERITRMRTLASTLTAASVVADHWGLPLDHWPDWGWTARGLARGRYADVRSFDDGLVVSGPDGGARRMSHRAALVWALCGGLTRPEVLARFAGLAELNDRLDDDEQRLGFVVDRLLDAGLVVDHSDRDAPGHHDRHHELP
ncbi:MAG: hypothetical protein ACRD29_03340 [Acidimicrobiales bacterium]